MDASEQWREVPSEPRILVSSLGRVMRKPFIGKMPHGGQRQYLGKASAGQWDGCRYIYVLSGKTYKVARLVCEAFSGQPPANSVCMHLDENSRNNTPDNLAWGTQKENLNAPGFIRYCKARTGDSSPTTKARKKKAA